MAVWQKLFECLITHCQIPQAAMTLLKAKPKMGTGIDQPVEAGRCTR